MLHFALREGFDNERVVVLLNDQVIYDKEGVSTDLRIGHADSFAKETVDGPMRVAVQLPNRGLTGSIVLQGLAEKHLGVAIEGAQVEFTVSEQAFHYM